MLRRCIWRCLSPVTLILLVSIWAAGAPKADGSLPSLPLDGVFQTNWTLADFDGDQNPDLVQARNAGTSYRVDIDLTGRERTGSFTFANPDAFEVDLAAIDVDGDRDLDLIVKGRLRGQKIGIYINNGAGTFSRGPANLYPESF